MGARAAGLFKDSLRHVTEWEPEPSMDRVVDGVPSRVDRLRCLGNAVVPQVGEVVGRVARSILESG
jgi:DNA (cytosine-5)-methyltransferase 1